MAIPSENNPIPPDRHSSLHDFKQMNANDLLIESIHKAMALSTILATADLDDYSESTQQTLSSIILDNLRAASEALDFLRQIKKGWL